MMYESVIALRMWENINDELDLTKPISGRMFYAHDSYKNNNVPTEEEILNIPMLDRQAILIRRDNIQGGDYEEKIEELKKKFYILSYDEVVENGFLEPYEELQNREPEGTCNS
ncbi:MAG: hypothetical protein M0R03_08895 [Novosphingobium sp.]|nr:hypothetical protein [Novosphingobium sp.]